MPGRIARIAQEKSVRNEKLSKKKKKKTKKSTNAIMKTSVVTAY